MDMINIVEFLENEGEQTIQGKLGYIKRETGHIQDDQADVLKWVISEGLLPSSDAVNLHGRICENIDRNNAEFLNISNSSFIGKKKKNRLQELATDTARLIDCRALLERYTDKNGLPIRSINPA